MSRLRVTVPAAPATAGNVPGKRASFEDVLSGNLDALYNTALRLCDGRRDDADDLLQETALKGFMNFERLEDRGAARAWLFSILVRTNLNRRRSLKRRGEQTFTDMTEAEYESSLAEWTPMPASEDIADRAELRDGINDALRTLHHSLRSVVMLVDVEGFTQREAATMLEVPEGTVASRLYRAHRLLRDSLRVHAQDRFIGGEE